MRRCHVICVDDEAIVLQSLRRELKQDLFFGDIAVDAADRGRRRSP
jgi:hypothetical protein